ncbi:NAD(P)H-binding protein [Pseudomonas gingeri]|uniref:NAD(P)H-binding protein n=1 Tax=Pseudomonas gingeri TaxID=117681 RepID=UPI0015A20263|nr:NAD(P)H-binding protein [Pseudomonas gingeri]NVZ29588.1 NAD(P)H-binding protein [Pseudomonas gingeri]NWA08567.1 NAD(P)H-binding protein [Pseudomonas gingeri]
MYVITGATSRTGSQIARRLLAAGQPVRVIGRSAERLQGFVDLGAEASVAEPTDALALARAFQGAKAAWIMLQPNYVIDSPDFRAFQDSVTRALSAALLQSPVTHAVVLSSWGADLPSGNGPVAGLHVLERRLAAHSGLNVLNLRAGYFMENTLSFADSILAEKVVLSPFDPEVRMPLVAIDDIVEAAVEQLLRLDFSGQQALELQGHEDLCLGEATRRIGQVIGRPDLEFRQISEQAFVDGLLAAGASDSIIGLMCEVVVAINGGLIRARQPRSSKTTGTVRYEDFVRRSLLPRLDGLQV